MRKLLNVLTGAAAFGVCGIMLYLSYEAGKETFIYNAVFFGIMAFVLLMALIVGFSRIERIKKSLRKAEAKLKEYNENKLGIKAFLEENKVVFGIRCLDKKFKEYLSFSRKSEGSGDIADYINEDSTDAYIGGRVLELVPDILTSLGILGTFVGLVWGLRGFDPVSYSAMANSISSLIDGIKVAFVTSIMGISLSVVFSFWFKNEQSDLTDAFDKFLDQYYLCEAPNKGVTEMGSLISNQEKQTQAMEKLLGEIPESTAVSVSDHLTPVTRDLNETLDRFVNIVTLNQQELVDTVAKTVTEAMTKQFVAEFKDLRQVLDDTNEAQRENVRYLSSAHEEYEQSLKASTKRILLSSKEDEARRKEINAEFKTQQKTLSEFVTNVNNVMERINENAYEDLNSRIMMTKQIEACQKMCEEMERHVLRMHKESTEFMKNMANAKSASVKVEVKEVRELTDKIDQLVDAINNAKKRGLF